MNYPSRLLPVALASGLVVLLVSAPSLAQQNFKRAIQDSWRFYEGHEYDRALERLEDAKRLAQQDKERVRAFLCEGMILAALTAERQAVADKAFREVLSQYPELELPTKTPSYVKRHFDELRDSLSAMPEGLPASTPEEPEPAAAGNNQKNFGEALEQLQQHFASKEYDEALKQLTHAGERARNSEQRCTVSLYEGMIFTILAHQQRARVATAFRKALELDPNARLDEPERHKHVTHLFEEVGAEVQRALAQRSTLPREETARWKTGGGMARARELHTATLLPAGKVLITGGVNEEGALSECELYESVKDTWSSTDSMSTPRFRHTATLLPSGNVLVVGGENDEEGVLSTAELYNPTSGTWSPAGGMRTGRRHHTATLLASGKVLIAGGEDSSGNNPESAELYDPATGLWTVTGSLAHARTSHVAALLLSGRVMVVGGVGEQGVLPNSEVYDPETGSWSLSPGEMPAPFSQHQISVLPSGKVLVTGGYDGEAVLDKTALYDPATDTWLGEATTAHMPAGRAGHTATVLLSGKVLISGGEGSSEAASGSAQVYDPTTGTWLPTASMATARIGNTATLLPSGQVLIAGGSNDDAPLNSTELYVP